jgi:hypothetical protein
MSMSGSKTRFGFQGGSDPPDPEESRAARTVFGHDIHLQVPPGFTPPQAPLPPTPIPPAPPPWSPVRPPNVVLPPDLAENLAEDRPPDRRLRPRQSRLARFLGRWTRSGHFQPQSRMEAGDLDDLQVPRDTAGRNLLLVVLVALSAFGITFAVVRLRHRLTAPASVAPPQAVAQPAQTPVAAPPPASPALPQPSLPVAPAARGLGPVPARTAAGRKPAAKEHPATNRGSRAEPNAAEPPAHLKGELLPLRP